MALPIVRRVVTTADGLPCVCGLNCFSCNSSESTQRFRMREPLCFRGCHDWCPLFTSGHAVIEEGRADRLRVPKRDRTPADAQAPDPIEVKTAAVSAGLSLILPSQRIPPTARRAPASPTASGFLVDRRGSLTCLQIPDAYQTTVASEEFVSLGTLKDSVSGPHEMLQATRPYPDPCRSNHRAAISGGSICARCHRRALGGPAQQTAGDRVNLSAEPKQARPRADRRR